MMSPRIVWFVSMILTLSATFVFGQTDEPVGDEEERGARAYTTREERRKAGLKYELTEWMTFTGLVESEYLLEGVRLEEQSRSRDDEFSASLQLGLEVTPLSWAKIELVYEYDAATGDQVMDEAIAGFETGDFDLEAGILYPPFGEYFSHFVTGALLEFGETRDPGAVLSYTPNDRVDVSVFLFNGKAVQVESDDANLDWGFSAEYSPSASGTFAVSYISDLADSEHRFLKDFNDEYEKRVPALSGYALIGKGPFEITGEFVQALRSFQQLDPGLDKPGAWNLELAYYPKSDLEVALRYEGSRELEDAPKTRFGGGFTWRVTRNIYISAEYLHGRFDEGNAHYFGARVSVL